MLDLLEKHKAIIRNFRIISYDQEINSHKIKMEITLDSGSPKGYGENDY